MKIIRITDSIISEAVNRLNRVSGGESDGVTAGTASSPLHSLTPAPTATRG